MELQAEEPGCPAMGRKVSESGAKYQPGLPMYTFAQGPQRNAGTGQNGWIPRLWPSQPRRKNQ